MTDIIPDAFPPSAARTPQQARPAVSGAAGDAAALFWYAEALFFAYRDFISDPDRILDEIGFGRAHHRVLHFVSRYPGMRVADLLEILQITKQSLARVLGELIKKGYVVQRSGETDRRVRLLYPSAKGRALARRLAEPQLTKLREALSQLGNGQPQAVAQFLESMISGTGWLPAMKRSPGAGRKVQR